MRAAPRARTQRTDGCAQWRRCRFGDAPAAEASYVSPTSIRCVAPAAEPGAVQVEVSANRQQFSSGSGALLRYVTPSFRLSFGLVLGLV